jgi:hypothetical protein
MRAWAAVAGAVVAVGLGGAGSAAAEVPGQPCPDFFMLAPEAFFEGAGDKDNNGNGLVCVKPNPGGQPTFLVTDDRLEQG